jgi:hypothetical protein
MSKICHFNGFHHQISHPVSKVTTQKIVKTPPHKLYFPAQNENVKIKSNGFVIPFEDSKTKPLFLKEKVLRAPKTL